MTTHKQYPVGDHLIDVFDDAIDFLTLHSINDDLVPDLSLSLGWADGRDKGENLYALYDHEQVEQLGLTNTIDKIPRVQEGLTGYKFIKAALNVVTPISVHHMHVHAGLKVVLLYLNMEWKDGWHGETLFYDENGKDIVFASPYVAGRVVMFDGNISHAIRPQSIDGPKFRYTMSLFFEKAQSE